MTCIVGLEHKGSVYLGADSAISDDSTITTIDPTEKLFHLNDSKICIGACGSLRLMQAIKYGFAFTKDDVLYEKNDTKFLVDNFVEILRTHLENKNILVDNGLPNSNLLLAFNKQLWVIDTELQVYRSLTGYAAIGTGAVAALGALEALRDVDVLPEEKIYRALRAAALHIHSVRGPFCCLKLHNKIVKTIKL